MKRIVLLLSLVSMTVFTGCEGDQGPQGVAGPDSIVFEILNADFSVNGNGEFTIYRTFNNELGFNLYDSETVLVYRMSDVIDANTPVWQLIPRTLYLDEGELDYDFDFSKEDFTIYAGGTYDLTTTPEFLNNQTFRILVIPGSFANRGGVDFNDYNAVIKAFNINDSKVKILK